MLMHQMPNDKNCGAKDREGTTPSQPYRLKSVSILDFRQLNVSHLLANSKHAQPSYLTVEFYLTSCQTHKVTSLNPTLKILLYQSQNRSHQTTSGKTVSQYWTDTTQSATQPSQKKPVNNKRHINIYKTHAILKPVNNKRHLNICTTHTLFKSHRLTPE